MDKELMFSSKYQNWETPDDFFRKIDEQNHFTMDVCATAETAKCSRYFTPQINGLKQSWQGERCWMNPPYGKAIMQWIEKASHEISLGDCFVMALLPARTDTRWFHHYIYNIYGVNIEFIKGRLRFKGAKYPAPFPSMLVRFQKSPTRNG